MRPLNDAHERPLARVYWISLLIVLLTLEAISRVLHPAFLAHAPDGYISNVAHVDDVLSRARDESAILLLGDSVLGPSALLEHHVAAPRSKSLSSKLRQSFALANTAALSLGADGMLPADMTALVSHLPHDYRGGVVVILNARMFSSEFQLPNSARFFPFLKPLQQPETLSPESSDDVRLGNALFETLSKNSVLFRSLHQLRGYWFVPSPEGAIQRVIEDLSGYEGEGDLKEAILRQKVAPFYAPRVWSRDDPQIQELLAMVSDLASRRIPVTVVFSPQNPDFIMSPSDQATFTENVSRLGGWAQKAGATHVHLFADRWGSDSFLDHCHLTPEANARLAQDIVRIVREGV